MPDNKLRPNGQIGLETDDFSEYDSLIKKELKKKSADIIRSLPKTIVMLIAFIGLLFFLLVFVIPSVRGAKNTGKAIGFEIGNATGKIVGTYQGLTIDAINGAQAGMQAGLSAEDTTVSVANKIQSLGAGKLEILSADIKLNIMNLNGEEKESYMSVLSSVFDKLLHIGETAEYGPLPSYARLFVLQGKMIFTVDLNEADIEYSSNGQKIIVTLSDPKVEVSIDETKTETVAEYFPDKSKHTVNGMTAVEGALKSRARAIKKSPESFEDYDLLMTQAKESAESQITALAQAATGNNMNVEVKWRSK